MTIYTDMQDHIEKHQFDSIDQTIADLHICITSIGVVHERTQIDDGHLPDVMNMLQTCIKRLESI